MDVKEIRVGNLIAVNDGTIVELDSELLSKLLTQTDKLEHFSGIAINETALEKLDFSLNENGQYVHSLFPDLLLQQTQKQISVWKNGVQLCAGELFVHQLQNLFYALTGTDLVYIEPDNLVEEIYLAADSIMGQYIPDDGDLDIFNFPIQVRERNFLVFYRKDADGFWELSHHEAQ